MRLTDHTVSADRVVNIDGTSCRLLPVHQNGWGRRGVKEAQLQGNTREATTFTVTFSMDPGPLDMLVQIVHAGKTDAVLPEQPWPYSSRHVRERLGNDHHDPAVRGHSGQRFGPEQGRTGVDPSLGNDQRPRQRGHPGRHEDRFPSRRAVLHPAAKHFVLAALRRGRLPQLQELQPGASERHSCPLRPRWLVRRRGHEQGMATPVFGRLGISRSHGPLRQKPGVDDWLASLARRQRRRFP